jgi:hypothetical protein
MDRNKKTAVFGIYPSLEAANNATDVLVKGGTRARDFNREPVTTLLNES